MLLAAICAISAIWACWAFAGIGANPANDSRLINKPLEGYRNDRATRCDKQMPKGTEALKSWLGRHTDGSFWGSYRCEKWSKASYSLHAESRAIDWAMDSRNSAIKRQAMKLIQKRWLARDRRGNDNALARRMGIQGIIYNCRSWYGGDGGLGRYSYCFKDNGKRKKHLDPTAAHMDHIHVELSDRGAKKKTSFWRSGIR